MLLTSTWRIRENRRLEGDDYYTFSYPFLNSVCILGSTTNVNPRNVVGYIYHILKIPSIGECELEERFTITNKYPKIIIRPRTTGIYYLKFRYAMPVGNCQIKIWESESSDL